ncbi:Phage integrase family protein [Algoriphagus faecimaris]|uniref:Phage integrase family protein n=1 Tax=Algoriphagus faecimaris TaxID=686796 RepID=A0A1G6WI36_9BACT|nr:tyrosine-type recombinase/integrase [Algoriphagus faecimaris]SDD64897.1 Phage integrase family protein [Algoriphagus faecimaris]
MANYSFILFPTKSPETKTIYEIITHGNQVVHRKSLGIRITEKNWDKTKKRVKSKEPNAQEINRILREKEEQFQFENPRSQTLNTEKSCALQYMEQELERGYQDGTKKVSTYNKYRTVLSTLRKVVQEKFGTKYLPFKKLKDLETIRQITIGLQRGYGKSGKPKKPAVISNYISILKSFIDHWNRYSGTQSPVNSSTFFNFIQKKQVKKLAPSITRHQIKELENYVPVQRRKRCYTSQILSKNIFLFQYYSAGIRFIDAITMTNTMIMEDKLVIPIRKTSDFISAPFYFPMMEVLNEYFPHQYQQAMNDVKLGKVILDARSIQQLFRLEGIDFVNLNHDQLTGIIREVTSQQSDSELTHYLFDIQNRLETQIIKYFFKLVKDLPAQFIFPMLIYDDFKDSLENGKDFTQEQEYDIHRARTRHNSALKRISENMEIPTLTGHVPRHTLANHMAYMGNSEEEIRQVLGHANVRTTKIYLRERHGFSGSFDIMKRFHQVKK